jgi:KGK domain
MNLDKNDVISMETDDSFVGASTFTVEEALMDLISHLDDYHVSWVKDGIKCSALNSSTGGWKKGKVRLSIEFISDEPPQAQGYGTKTLS